jgi:PTS system mannose-specific IIA component
MAISGIILATHGSIGQAMLQAAERMLGPQERCAAFALDESMGREDLASALQAKLLELGPSLVIVDMLGGSPWNAALLHGLPKGSEVLAGASLPLLLEALTLRAELEPRALAAEVILRTAGSVVAASPLLERKPA